MKIKIRNKKGKIVTINVNSKKDYEKWKITKKDGQIWRKIKVKKGKKKKREKKGDIKNIKNNKRIEKDRKIGNIIENNKETERKRNIERITGKKDKKTEIEEEINDILEKKKLEEEIFIQVRNIPNIPKEDWQRQINPNERVLTNNKIYNSYNELINDQKNIYLGVIFKGIAENNPKMLERMYQLRDKILRDGFIIEIDLFGGDGFGNLKGDYYLGTIEVKGIMLEEAQFLESDLIGSTGYLQEIANKISARSSLVNEGEATLKQNNTKNKQITIQGIKMRFNYA